MKLHAITLATGDDKRFAFTATGEENLLEAALRQDILLPANCRNGSCGSCVAHVDSGLIQLGDISSEVLSAEQRANGDVLLCRTCARSDVQLTAPYPSDKVRLQQVIRRDTAIADLQTIAKDTLLLRLQLQPHATLGSGAEFEPGQYMELRVPGTDHWKPFSIASIPNWDGLLEFIITLRDGGELSGHLRDAARVGQPLEVRGPFGDLALQDTGRSRWFVAGGSGLAPLLSMLRRMADWGDETPARLYFGTRHQSGLLLRDELHGLRQQLPGLEIQLCISQPEADWPEPARNVVTSFGADLAGVARRPDVYVCGSDRLVQGIRNAAQLAGLPPAQLFGESFGAMD